MPIVLPTLFLLTELVIVSECWYFFPLHISNTYTTGHVRIPVKWRQSGAYFGDSGLRISTGSFLVEWMSVHIAGLC